uniref:Cold shock domain containing C2, RNA binding a n=1 Tax=Cyprinus carpio TaxID=7962 RepID=A0A8C1L7M2_CYPCA
MDISNTSTSDRKLHCPHKPVSLSLPFLREGSNVLERKPPQTGEPPIPLLIEAKSGPVFKGICKNFSRSQGHGFIRPSHGGEDIFHLKILFKKCKEYFLNIIYMYK